MLTKEQFEENILKYGEENQLGEKAPKVKLMLSSLSGFYHVQTIDIRYLAENQDQTNGFNIANYLSGKTPNSYQFIYTLKSHTLDYQTQISIGKWKYTHFKVTDDNWGNLFKSCLDLQDYDWIMNNEHAKHVLEIDPKHFYEMEYVLKFGLDFFNKERVKYQC